MVHQGVKAFKFEHAALALDFKGSPFLWDTLYIAILVRDNHFYNGRYSLIEVKLYISKALLISLLVCVISSLYNDAFRRVKEQERATEILIDRYENEIKNLKTLIRRQQKQLEDMVNDKR